MALTVTNAYQAVPGAATMVFGTITFDASYVTGGMPITSALLGGPTGLNVKAMTFSPPRGAASTAASGLQFDAANQKVLVFNSTAGAQTANATNLATVVSDYIAWMGA